MEEIKAAGEILFEYLRGAIYNPSNAKLDIDSLPLQLQEFGRGLCVFVSGVIEAAAFANELANGNLRDKKVSPFNQFAAPLKSLEASLRHLTWQTQQVASGDYSQRVDFMGDFSYAFNNMVKKLERRWIDTRCEQMRLQRHIDLLLLNCPDPILIFDSESKLEYVGDAYLKSFDIQDSRQVLGKGIREIFSHLTTQEFLCDMEQILSQDTTKTAERDVAFECNGRRRHYQIQVCPMLNECGEGEGTLMLLHEVSEIIAAQKEAERARELAERSLQAKSEFLARMSHEMRTPLNVIMGMATIYRTANNHAKKDDCLAKISESSHHLLGIVDDILDMSEAMIRLDEAAFDFSSLIKKIVDETAFFLDKKVQSLSYQIDSNIPTPIVADSQKLSKVICNLLANATKFTHSGGKIWLDATLKNGSTLKITISDNGIGIPKEQQKNLFLPFEQLDGGSKRKYGGIGLGLATCKRLIEVMGGSISLNSRQGEGAAFTVEIPIKYGLESEEAQIIPTQNHGNASLKGTHKSLYDIEKYSNKAQTVHANSEKACNDIEQIPNYCCKTNDLQDEKNIFLGKKILVAEDIDINCEIIEELLAHTGIEIESVKNGQEAMEKLLSSPWDYHLILMDINMPVMDGLEATRAIRSCEIQAAKSIPIVAMTANVYNEDIKNCLDSGMNAHLGKPIDPRLLIATLKEYLLEKHSKID